MNNIIIGLAVIQIFKTGINANHTKWPFHENDFKMLLK